MCSSCFAIPSITIQLLLTSSALLYGQRSLCKDANKWTRRIAVLLSLALAALGLFLLVLSLNEEFRGSIFAGLCARQSQKTNELDEHRCSLLEDVGGRVLEFGPGPGTNFKCFQDSAAAGAIERYVAVEPNLHFEEKLRKEKDSRGLEFPLEIVGIRGEEVDIRAEDVGTFDAVIMTHVLCSVDSPENVLANAERALKPNGRMVFMEHVSAQEGTYMSYVQNAVAPILNIVANGCTFRNLRDAIDDYLGDRFEVRLTDFEASVPVFMHFIRPHIKGVATKK